MHGTILAVLLMAGRTVFERKARKAFAEGERVLSDLLQFRCRVLSQLRISMIRRPPQRLVRMHDLCWLLGFPSSGDGFLNQIRVASKTSERLRPRCCIGLLSFLKYPFQARILVVSETKSKANLALVLSEITIFFNIIIIQSLGAGEGKLCKRGISVGGAILLCSCTVSCNLP